MKINIEKKFGYYCLVLKYGEKLPEDIQKLVEEEYSTELRIPILLTFALWFSCSVFVYTVTKMIQTFICK
ncbi:MAG: hypothetical protein ABIH89_11015 [Elusimicrobiota bacterium]